MTITPRYSVCIPGIHIPVEVLATNDRVKVLQRASELRDAVVYDWTTGEQVTA